MVLNPINSSEIMLIPLIASAYALGVPKDGETEVL